MNDSNSPHDDDFIDPREPGKARTVYTVVAVTVVIALILAIAGNMVWDQLF